MSNYIPADDHLPMRRYSAIKEERKNRRAQLNTLYLETEASGFKAERARREMEAIQSEQHANAAYAHEFAYPGQQQGITYIFALAHYPAVYALNCILIREPMVFLGGNVLAFFIPALLLLLEMGLCSILTAAGEGYDREQSLERKRILIVLSHLLILVTPGLVIASFLARLENFSLLELGSELIALAVLLVIAVATDVLVVFGFTTHRRAFAFLLHHVTRIRSSRRYKHLDEVLREYVREVLRSYGEYQTVITEFNQDFPDHTLTPHRFSEAVQAIVSGLPQPHHPPF